MLGIYAYLCGIDIFVAGIFGFLATQNIEQGHHHYSAWVAGVIIFGLIAIYMAILEGADRLSKKL